MEKQIQKQQSISNMEGEVTVICVDNTTLLAKTGVYIAQAMAIALYCDEKIKVPHPDNMVALVPMGALQGTSYVKPTRDLNEILPALKGRIFKIRVGLTLLVPSCTPLALMAPYYMMAAKQY
ncbi:hypothetical protein Tco_0821547 [Tanacetum coccineum]|uniref:Uncharacterized protein n=1 Tax=Tanacetum coccineum TaxID=301880 RepID=A0ABQ5AGW7_9ASTR